MRLGHVMAAMMIAGCGRIGFGVPADGPQDIPSDAAADAALATTGCWPAWHTGTIDFAPPQRIDALAIGFSQNNPSLTRDDLTLYFSSTDGTTGNVHRAIRPDRNQPWASAGEVTELTSPADDSRFATSTDGLFGVLASDRGGNFDLYSVTRADTASPFGTPTLALLTQVNSAALDFDPELSADGLRLYFAPNPGVQHIAVSSRPTMTGAFLPPVVVAELDVNGRAGDPAVSPDELVIVMSSNLPPTDIYYAVRARRGDPFAAPVPLTAVNVVASYDNDPDLSSDGCELYFVSDRAGQPALYVAVAR